MSDPYAAVAATGARRSRAALPLTIGSLVLLGVIVALGISNGWFTSAEAARGAPLTKDGSSARDSSAEDTSAQDTCKRAADRYVTCMGELLGPEAAAHAASKEKDGVAECAADDKTVAMYVECLPSASCPAFMDCMTAYAEKTAPR